MRPGTSYTWKRWNEKCSTTSQPQSWPPRPASRQNHWPRQTTERQRRLRARLGVTKQPSRSSRAPSQTASPQQAAIPPKANHVRPPTGYGPTSPRPTVTSPYPQHPQTRAQTSPDHVPTTISHWLQTSPDHVPPSPDRSPAPPPPQAHRHYGKPQNLPLHG